MARHARFLARIGVNMVRLHTQIAPDVDGGPITAVNEKERDGIWRMVAALKREGIYTTISPYWANRKQAAGWGIAGYTGQTDLWGLLFFNPQLQAGYKAWVKALYDRPNPYTGLRLADDPAVAIIQVQNEDGMFFWTMQGLHPEQQALLGKKFAAWLTTHYGTLDAAKAAWAGASDPGDDWAGAKVGILPTWQLTQDADRRPGEASDRPGPLFRRHPARVLCGHHGLLQKDAGLPSACQRLQLVHGGPD